MPGAKRAAMGAPPLASHRLPGPRSAPATPGAEGAQPAACHNGAGAAKHLVVLEPWGRGMQCRAGAVKGGGAAARWPPRERTHPTPPPNTTHTTHTRTRDVKQLHVKDDRRVGRHRRPPGGRLDVLGERQRPGDVHAPQAAGAHRQQRLVEPRHDLARAHAGAGVGWGGKGGGEA